MPHLLVVIEPSLAVPHNQKSHEATGSDNSDKVMVGGIGATVTRCPLELRRCAAGRRGDRQVCNSMLHDPCRLGSNVS